MHSFFFSLLFALRLLIDPARAQTASPPFDGKTSMPTHTLVASVESAHGVSDVNHVAWCRLSPAKAAETLRRLEGGEGDADEDEDTARREGEEDPRWARTKDMFASAGDDGVVKVWVVDQVLEGVEPSA